MQRKYQFSLNGKVVRVDKNNKARIMDLNNSSLEPYKQPMTLMYPRMSTIYLC